MRVDFKNYEIVIKDLISPFLEKTNIDIYVIQKGSADAKNWFGYRNEDKYKMIGMTESEKNSAIRCSNYANKLLDRNGVLLMLSETDEESKAIDMSKNSKLLDQIAKEFNIKYEIFDLGAIFEIGSINLSGYKNFSENFSERIGKIFNFSIKISDVDEVIEKHRNLLPNQMTADGFIGGSEKYCPPEYRKSAVTIRTKAPSYEMAYILVPGDVYTFPGKITKDLSDSDDKKVDEFIEAIRKDLNLI